MCIKTTDTLTEMNPRLDIRTLLLFNLGAKTNRQFVCISCPPCQSDLDIQSLSLLQENHRTQQYFSSQFSVCFGTVLSFQHPVVLNFDRNCCEENFRLTLETEGDSYPVQPNKGYKYGTVGFSFNFTFTVSIISLVSFFVEWG